MSCWPITSYESLTRMPLVPRNQLFLFGEPKGKAVLKGSSFLIFDSSFSTEDVHSPKLTVCQESIGKIDSSSNNVCKDEG